MMDGCLTPHTSSPPPFGHFVVSRCCLFFQPIVFFFLFFTCVLSFSSTHQHPTSSSSRHPRFLTFLLPFVGVCAIYKSLIPFSNHPPSLPAPRHRNTLILFILADTDFFFPLYFRTVLPETPFSRPPVILLKAFYNPVSTFFFLSLFPFPPFAPSLCVSFTHHLAVSAVSVSYLREQMIAQSPCHCCLLSRCVCLL